MKLWGMLVKNQKIRQNIVVESAQTDFMNAVEECLEQICYKLDLARPMILKKHWEELESFGRTRFMSDVFLEPISFDALEIEQIVERKKQEGAK